jgi:hypothetical protein
MNDGERGIESRERGEENGGDVEAYIYV